VWMDALTNYITGVNGLQVIPNVTPEGLHKFWPAAVHIIGKDILWFHTVIWPTLLFSANVPLPLTVYAHGFVNDKEGKKMSKSLGNVVDPHDMLDKYCSDTFRWCVFIILLLCRVVLLNICLRPFCVLINIFIIFYSLFTGIK